MEGSIQNSIEVNPATFVNGEKPGFKALEKKKNAKVLQQVNETPTSLATTPYEVKDEFARI